MNALPAALAAIAASVPAAPTDLPASGARATGAKTWIVAASRPAPALARRFQAKPLGHDAYVLPRANARAFARALRRRHAFFYAEPDHAIHRTSFDADPGAWARGAVVSPTLTPPSATAAPVAVIDDFVDATLPDLAGHVGYLNGDATSVIEGPHGTMVASAVSAAANGSGLLGVLPGNTILSGGVPTQFTCSDTAPLIYEAIKQKARVINMSYGATSQCFVEFQALQYALGLGMLAVASAGNEFQEGNPVTFPAGYPHVLSVAALNEQLEPAYFSEANAAVDISAPGVNVPLNIPLVFDTNDGTQDGFTLADGTSFAAPMTAGAAAWILAARPKISGAQAGDLLRRTAIDVDKQGYDINTGFGLINVDRAMAAKTPKRDPLEPNDGMEWVDGRAFNKPDPFVWTGNGTFSFEAGIDEIEDPVDVYRFKMAARSDARITANPSTGDPALFVFNSTAKRTSQTGRIIASSTKAGGATEVIRLTTSAGRSLWGFLVVVNSPSSNVLDSRYRLGFKRTG